MRLHLIQAIGIGLILSDGLKASAAGDPAFDADHELIARFHYVGAERLAADANAASLNAIMAVPETAALKEQTLQKLATAPFRFLQGHAAGTNDFAPLIRPLLDDLLRAESFAEVRGPTNEVPEFMLAVHVGKDRASVWRSNLKEVLNAWTGVPVKEINAEGFSGWELKKHHQPNCLRFFQADDWVLFGWGQEDIRSQTGMLRRIKEKNPPVEVPGNALVDLQIDWSRLKTGPPPLGPFKLASMHLSVEGRKDFVRPQVIMEFAEPLGLSLKPWQVPTNLIHDPITSFTAIRGVISKLDDLPSVKALNASPLPDQLFGWSTQQIPFETCLAAPVAEATNYVDQIAPGLVSLFNDKVPKTIGDIKATPTNGMIFVGGLPMVFPYVRAIQETNGYYVLAGLFPSPRREEPFPPDLLAELLNHTNLVYYDWERTGTRLPQWRYVSGLVFLLCEIAPPVPDTPGEKWIDAVAPKVGNCGTEVTQTAPNELTLIRNSPLGLTSLELFWLARWLDSPGFPLGMYGETARWRPPSR